MILKRILYIFLAILGFVITSCRTVATPQTNLSNESANIQNTTSEPNVLEYPTTPTATSSITPPPTLSSELLKEEFPQPRAGHVMVYDSKRQVVVLFGGYSKLPDESNGYNLNDTWEYDGVSWQKIEVATSPPSRSGHAMAYDEKRGVVVLFGGRSSDKLSLNDTWEYDGQTWQPETDLLDNPSQRVHAAMSYDPRTETVLLFGGYAGYLTNDLWEYDGLNWKQLDVEPADTRLMHSPMFPKMVYGGNFGIVAFIEDSLFSYSPQMWEIVSEPSGNDAGLDQIYLFSGFSFDVQRNVFVLFGGQNVSNDTWEFDGTIWNRFSSPPALSARSEHVIVYDPNRNVTVLFGGVDVDGNYLNDTWEYDGGTWIQR